ncbi:MAG: DUF1523 family protein [Pseudomonadota bacterium]
MLYYIKWTFWLLFWAAMLSFLHYTLPQWDIVRITDTYERRETPGENSWFWTNASTGSGQAADNSRDVFFIQGVRENGRPAVYRNEDTGFGWPPFFKINSADLQTRAADLVSTPAEPDWVAIRHYGWRLNVPTAYPNALRIRDVEGPDTRIIPWVSIAILVGLACVFWAIYARWRRFWANRVDPLLDGDDI